MRRAATMDSSWPAVCAARPKMPPSSDAAAPAACAAMPSLLPLKVDMYPLPHFSQKNLNW